MSFLRRLFGTDAPEPEPTMTVTAETTDLDAADGMVIEQLRQSGADLSLAREVIHYLYLPSEEAAHTAADRLRPAGYTTEVRPAAGPPGPNPWLVQATIEQVVTDAAIATARRLFTGLAVATSGDYDGWEAAATP